MFCGGASGTPSLVVPMILAEEGPAETLLNARTVMSYLVNFFKPVNWSLFVAHPLTVMLLELFARPSFSFQVTMYPIISHNNRLKIELKDMVPLVMSFFFNL